VKPLPDNKMARRTYDHLFKVVLVGDYDVGKQELLKRYVDNVFMGKYVTTVAVDLMVKTIELDGKRVKLQLWDTVGNERYRSLTTAYFRGAHAVILVYDVTKEATFHSLIDWSRQVEQYASPEVVKMIIGNRCDCEPEEKAVSTESGQALADELKCGFFEVSPKTGLNVKMAFFSLASTIKAKFVGSADDGMGQDSAIVLGERKELLPHGGNKSFSSCC